MIIPQIQNILIFDDDEIDCNYASLIAKEFGVKNVFKINQLIKFKEILQKGENVDLMLISLSSSFYSGFHAIDFIRDDKNVKIKTVPIVVSSTKASHSQTSFLNELMCFYILPKPYDKKIFARTLNTSWQNMQKWEHADGFWSQIEKLIDAHKFEEALLLVQNRQSKIPKSAINKVMEAKILWKSEKIQEAKVILQGVIDILPQYPLAHQMLSSILIEEGHLESSLNHIHVANHQNPYLASRWQKLGDIYMKFGEWDEAEKYYNKSLKLFPHNMNTLQSYLKILTIQNRGEAYFLALQFGIHKKMATFFNLKAIESAKQGAFSLAISLYKYALKFVQEPEKKASLLYNIALSYLKQGEKESAEQVLIKVLKVYPKHEKSQNLWDDLKVRTEQVLREYGNFDFEKTSNLTLQQVIEESMDMSETLYDKISPEVVLNAFAKARKMRSW